MSDEDWLRTGIGAADADSITLVGRDLAEELMGRVTFTELSFLLVRGRMPTPGETTLLDAVLVSLADHGLTPTVLAARLTYTGAPESLQGAVAAGPLGAGGGVLGVVEDAGGFLPGVVGRGGGGGGPRGAVAAGLLGAGSVFLGVVEDAAVFLADVVGRAEDDAGLRAAADAAVTARLEAGRRVPGLGHPIHKAEDPRTPRMYAIAEEAGVLGPHLRALELVAAAAAERTDRALPINGAGAAGAALADIGFPPHIVRGFALLARTAGGGAHPAGGMGRPLGQPLFPDVGA